MARLKNIEELKKIREEAQRELGVRRQTGTRIIIGMGTCGIAAGAREVMQAFLKGTVRPKNRRPPGNRGLRRHVRPRTFGGYRTGR